MTQLTEQPQSARRVLASALLRPEAITVVLLLACFAVGAKLLPEFFLDASYLLDSTSLYMEVGLLSLAMTFVIITGNIDLSVAGGSSLVGVTLALLHARGVPMGWCIAAALTLGVTLGLFNALLITLLRLPSLTVTLGTMALYQGIAQILLGDRSQGGLPEWFVGIDFRHLDQFLGPPDSWNPALRPLIRFLDLIPFPLAIFLIVAVLFAVVLSRTVFGRRLYAIGTNEPASIFSGLPVPTTKIIVFALSGLMMGCAGLLAASRLGSTQFNMAVGWELSAITAVVLGGTDIFGGRGSIFGTVVALFLLVLVQTEINLKQLPPSIQLTASGVLLVLSVLLTNLTGRLKSVRS